MNVIHLTAIIVGFSVVLRYWSKLLDLTNDRAVGDNETSSLMMGLRTQFNDNILWYIVINFIVYMPLVFIEVFLAVRLWKDRRNKAGGDS